MSHLFRVMLVMGIVLMSAGLALADESASREIRRELDRFEQQLQAGQGQQAMQTFMAIKAKFPEHADVRAYEGRILLLQNNAQGAQPALQAALEKQPHHPLATALLANIEFRTFKVTEAQARVSAALEKHPDAWELLQISAEMLVAQQKQEEAKPFLEKIIANKANPPRAIGPAHAHLGAVLLQQDKPSQAVEHLRQSLAINWDLQVAVAYVQALDKANAPIADLRKAVEELRQRVNAAANHPQIAQIRQHVNQQIASAENKLKAAAANDRSAQAIVDFDKKLAQFDAEMAKEGKEYNDYTAGRYAREAKTIARQITDQKIQEEKLSAAGLRELRMTVRGLRGVMEGDPSSSALTYRAGLVEAALSGQSGPEAEEAASLAKQAREKAGEADRKQVEQVLALAGEGWMFARFYSPTGEDAKLLKERGLPERYNHFSTAAKKALENFYEPLAAKRPNLPLEAAVEAYVKAPGDAAARAQVVKLMAERLKGIDFANEAVTYSDLIPARIWTKPHGYNRALNIDNKLDDKRELAWTINDRLGSYNLRKNHRWQAMIDGYTRVIEQGYPRVNVLTSRAEAYLFAGQYQKAYEDALLVLAVDAWERANSIGWSEVDAIQRTIRQPLLAAKVYGELASNKLTRSGVAPSQPVAQALANLRQGKWDALVDFMITKHPDYTVEARLASNLRYNFLGNEWHERIQDAAAAQYAKASPARKAELLKAFETWGGSHAGIAMIRHHHAQDAKEKEGFLFSAVNNGSRDPAAYYALGKYYEQNNDKSQAMLAYNVAAGGQVAGKLTGLMLQAAQARDRLEGATPDFQSLYAVYKEHYQALLEKYGKEGSRTPNRECAFLEGIVNRLLNRNARRVSVLGARADARTGLGDLKGAIEDLREMIALKSPLAPLAHAIIGNHLRDLGEYESSIEQYTQAIEGGNNESWVFYQRAMNHSRLGQFDAMLADLNTALEKNEKSTAALQERSKYYEYLVNDDEKALVDAKRAMELLKEANPDGRYFELNLRISNLEMKIARRNLNRAFGVTD